MGNCCSGTPEEEIRITTNKNTRQQAQTNFENILNDSEVSGLKGKAKMALIIKIQSHFRGTLARKKV